MTFKDFVFMESKDPIFEDAAYLIETQTASGEIVDPKEIHDTIKKAGDTPTIIGGHAFNVLAHTKRATQDVDLLALSPKKAAKAILKSHPEWHLDDRSHDYQQRILNKNEEEVVDILAYKATPVWSEVKKGSSLRGGYRIPNLENYIAMKWASFTHPERSFDGKARDEADMKTLLWQNMGKWAPATRANKSEKQKLMNAVQKASETADDLLDFEELFRKVEKDFLKK